MIRWRPIKFGKPSELVPPASPDERVWWVVNRADYRRRYWRSNAAMWVAMFTATNYGVALTHRPIITAVGVGIWLVEIAIGVPFMLARLWKVAEPEEMVQALRMRRLHSALTSPSDVPTDVPANELGPG